MTKLLRIALAAGFIAFPSLGFSNNIIAPVPAVANLRVAAVQVRVAPDRPGWTYKVGEPVRFSIAVTADNEPLTDANITYKVGPEMMPVEAKNATIPKEGLVIDGGTMKTPGFIRCIVTAEVAGKTYRGLATAALSPEMIQPTQAEPADFDAFWDAGKAELAKIPIDARLTLLPEACTSEVNVYHVSFRTVGLTAQQSRIFGMLCEPVKPGKYPAVLIVPGAGVRSYSGQRELAARGVIILEIGIHGIPVNLPLELYEQLRASALADYWARNLDNKDTYYYRRVYLGCIRANDFLTSRENYDRKNLVVMGGSQGGQLTIVTTALDRRVQACCVRFPAFCDVTGYLHGRAGGWPHMFRPDSKTNETFHATPTKIGTTSYYDTVNFAKRLKVPGIYSWGYNDETCPPTSMFAAYNQITAPKTLALALEANHPTIPEQSELLHKWLGEFLHLPK